MSHDRAKLYVQYRGHGGQTHDGRQPCNIALLSNLGPKATFGSIDLIGRYDALEDALSRLVDIAFTGVLHAGVVAHTTGHGCQVL